MGWCFVRGRRTAVVLQALATVAGVFLPLVAVVVYLGLAVFFFIDPLWIERVRRKVGSRKAWRPPGLR